MKFLIIKNMLNKRKKSHHRHSLLDSFDQYKIMVQQTDNIEDYELKERTDIAVIKYDRNNSSIELVNGDVSEGELLSFLKTKC